jgi:hypothetical protein
MNVLAEYPQIRTLSLGTRAHLSLAMAGWWSPAERRYARPDGGRVAPGMVGVAARPVVKGPIRFLHRVRVDGRYLPNGNPSSDPAEQWRLNLSGLETACAPESSSPWTFQAVHHLRDGATRTAQIQVVDMVVPFRPSGAAGTVTLDIVVPSGEFDYQAAS